MNSSNIKVFLPTTTVSINPINPSNPINPINPSNPINPINPINSSNPSNETQNISFRAAMQMQMQPR
jgi:hypothetical protein